MTSLRLNSKSPIDISQPIFMGIDVHKNTLSISFLHQEVLIGHFTIPNEPSPIKALLERYKDCQIFSAYEVGFSGYFLHFFLEDLGIKNIITPPNKMMAVVGDRVKTDKKDSRKIALLLSKGLLIANNIPEKKDILLRQFLRTRHQLVKKRVSSSNQIKLLLLQHNVKVPGPALNKKSMDKILNMDLPAELKSILEIQIDIYKVTLGDTCENYSIPFLFIRTSFVNIALALIIST